MTEVVREKDITRENKRKREIRNEVEGMSAGERERRNETTQEWGNKVAIKRNKQTCLSKERRKTHG